jgi:exonuclease SbcD
MRLAHTSDWHAGRILKRVDRLPELAAVLEQMGDDLEREKVDVLLMSGDVFDSGAPVAEAERVVFSFFKRLGRAGIETVVIAGNHDSPARMQASPSWSASMPSPSRPHTTRAVSSRSEAEPARPRRWPPFRSPRRSISFPRSSSPTARRGRTSATPTA